MAKNTNIPAGLGSTVKIGLIGDDGQLIESTVKEVNLKGGGQPSEHEPGFVDLHPMLERQSEENKHKWDEWMKEQNAKKQEFLLFENGNCTKIENQ